MIDPTPAQTKVLREIQDWLRSSSNKRASHHGQVRVLTGAAGTGKTSLAALAVESYRARFCAPTGKAALVLREKGCAGARTIHSLIYRPREGMDGRNRVVRFSVNPNAELGHGDVDVVVADECSMLGPDLMRDLLSFGVRVLLLGDPYQLPPVVDERGGHGPAARPGEVAGYRPDWHLDEVHRQARESGVLRLATDVREGRGFSRVPGAYGDDVRVLRADEADSLGVVCEVDQVLVGTRRARRDLNQWVRKAAGAIDNAPIPGDKVVCRRNNADLGLINGGQWMVMESDPVGFWRHQQHTKLVLETLGGDPDGPQTVEITSHLHYFEGREESLKGLSWAESKKHEEFDYGYAMTCHSAQGSQWDSVAILDESNVFGQDRYKWAYTAITRASKRVVLLF
jgi:exodeoxyribonuclease-5